MTDSCVDSTIDSLGSRLSEHEPNRANKGAGVILCILFVIGGFACIWVALQKALEVRGRLPLWAEKGDSWVSVIFVLFFGLFLFGLAAFLWRFVRKLFSLRVVLCENGFYVIQSSVTDVYAWDDIAMVDETVFHERLPLPKGPAALLIPTKTSRGFTVKRRDGKEFMFNANVLPDVDVLAVPLSNAARERNIHWRVTEQTG